MRIVDRAKRYVQKLTQGLGGGAHGKAVERLVGTVICGSLAAGSCVLWWMGRALGLNDERELKAFIQRVSRGLRKYAREIFSSVHAAHLAQVKPLLADGRDWVVAVDVSDLAKPYARRMEYLGRVRDGSRSRKDNPVIVPGYWLHYIVAVREDGRPLVLDARMYSLTRPMARSQNLETFTAVNAVRPEVPENVFWVFDRGYDSGRFIKEFSQQQMRWIIRLNTPGRHVVLPTGRDAGHRMPVGELAAAVDCRSRAKVRRVKRGVVQVETVRYGAVTVTLPSDGRLRTLLVIQLRDDQVSDADDVPRQGPLRNRLVYLVSEAAMSRDDQERMVNRALRRWGVEEHIRMHKQLTGFEQLRLMKYEAIQTLVFLTALAVAFLQYEVITRPQATSRIARTVPKAPPFPWFFHYRLAEALQPTLRRLYRRLWLLRRRRCYAPGGT